MKRTESQSIGDILRLALQENCMHSRLDECKAVEIWGAVIGEYIASQCRRPYVREGVMTVGVPNAPLRQELSMNRTRLRAAINREIGRETITEIRFTS
ncbi:MAG: DUF721 domain-containing protein [Muribaculaceae bacterium]|nr:DUF721 domain-containing protein [Muribaculaceae bacterium]